MLTSTVVFLHHLKNNSGGKMLTDVKHFSDVKTGAIIVSWQQL